MLEWVNEQWQSADKKDFTKRVFWEHFKGAWRAMVENGGVINDDWWAVDKFLRQSSVDALRRKFLKMVDGKYVVNWEQIVKCFLIVREKSALYKIVQEKKGQCNG